jgi:nucleoside-specific outer membrane channel protein Tsx
MKQKYALITAIAAAGISGAVHAADWSHNAIGVRWGSGFADPGITKDFNKTIFSFEHVSGDRLGTNLFVLDVLKSDSTDPAVGGGGGAQELYSLFQRTFSLSALTGNTGGYGIFKDINLVGRADFGSKDDAFGARPRKLRLGVSFALPVEKGFWNVSLQAYKHRDHNGIVGRDVSFNIAPLLASSWMIPIGGFATFSGYADFIGPKGKDGFGAGTKTEVIVFTKLMFNVAGATSGLRAGVGYEYWKNKYGTNSSVVPGAKQSLPLLLTEYHF